MTALEANALCGLGCSGRGRLRSGMKRMTFSEDYDIQNPTRSAPCLQASAA
jgi:hypothetical protein